jgi:hypothetical protein
MSFVVVVKKFKPGKSLAPKSASCTKRNGHIWTFQGLRSTRNPPVRKNLSLSETELSEAQPWELLPPQCQMPHPRVYFPPIELLCNFPSITCSASPVPHVEFPPSVSRLDDLEPTETLMSKGWNI